MLFMIFSPQWKENCDHHIAYRHIPSITISVSVSLSLSSPLTVSPSLLPLHTCTHRHSCSFTLYVSLTHRHTCPLNVHWFSCYTCFYLNSALGDTLQVLLLLLTHTYTHTYTHTHTLAHNHTTHTQAHYTH